MSAAELFVWDLEEKMGISLPVAGQDWWQNIQANVLNIKKCNFVFIKKKPNYRLFFLLK